SGALVRVPIQNNQLVKKGDLLFEIDPSTFQATVNLSRAEFDNMRDIVKSLAEQVDGLRDSVGQHEAELSEAESEIEGNAARTENARISFERARELMVTGTNTQRDLDDKSTAYQVARAQLNEARARVSQMTAGLTQAKNDLARGIANLGVPGAD